MSTSFETGDRQPLIICRLPDPHVSAVMEHVEASGHKATIWDLNAPTQIRVWPLSLNRQAFKFSAVWWRYKQTPREYAGVASNAEQFAAREWLHYLKALAAANTETLWLNDPWLVSARSNKFLNLNIASGLGWLVPKTLITNSLADAKEFIDECGSRGTVYKVLTYYFDAEGQTVFTSKIGTGDIFSHPDNVKMAPLQLQEQVSKKYELRVTVIGEEIFAAKIYSQESALTALDWRRDQAHSALYKTTELSEEWSNRILELHEAFGLHYGAYDFICNHEDQLVFLEVNPSGQFMWVELHTGLQISRALADALIRPRRRLASRCLTGITRYPSELGRLINRESIGTDHGTEASVNIKQARAVIAQFREPTTGCV